MAFIKGMCLHGGAMFNVLNPHARRRRAAIGEKEEFMVSEDNTRSAGFLAENGNENHRKVIAVRPFGSRCQVPTYYVSGKL